MKNSYLQDLQASVVVFLVALPLSLGIAMASDAPTESGIIAAIVGGIIVGLFGGAPLQVSGPAAGLTVIVYGLVQKFGFEATCAITLMAGGFQILFGILRFGEYTMVISPAVIHAMLAGIGVLISIAQTHVLMGHNPQGSAIANIKALGHSVSNLNLEATLLGLGTFLLLVIWKKYIAKHIQAIPGSLVAVVLGTVVAQYFALKIPTVKMAAQLVFTPHLSVFRWESIPLWIGPALTLTIIASAESLLCAIATDKLTKGKPTNLNKELIGQGLGNLISGLFWGLPITGVIVRSSANISNGGKTKLSAILHGVWILIFVTFFGHVIQTIPLTVLAALLIQVGLGLIKFEHVVHLKEYKEHTIYYVTLLGVIFINLLWGIGLGFALAIFLYLRQASRVSFVQKQISADSCEMTIQGQLSFLSVPKLLRELKSLPEKQNVRLEFNVTSLDHACIEAIRDWKTTYENQGGKVSKVELKELWSQLLPQK